MKPTLMLTFLLVAGLAGCVDDDAPVQEAVNPYAAGSGSADSHGEPTVDESAADVRMALPFWEATKDIVIRNDFGGASLSRIEVAADNADIVFQPSPDGNYQVVIDLYARALTPQSAEAALGRMTVEHHDELVAGVLRLSTIVETENQDDDFFEQVSAHITVYVPPSAGHDLRTATVNGNIWIQGLKGPAFTADSSNGDVEIAVVMVGSLSASTTNGDVFLHGVAERVAAASSNGNIVAVINSTQSGSYALATSNGDVVLGVNGTTSHGYDVRASTSNGQVIVELEDVEDVEPQVDGHRHVRTVGFEDRIVQVNAELTSSNGDVVVTDNIEGRDEAHH